MDDASITRYVFVIEKNLLGVAAGHEQTLEDYKPRWAFVCWLGPSNCKMLAGAEEGQKKKQKKVDGNTRHYTATTSWFALAEDNTQVHTMRKEERDRSWEIRRLEEQDEGIGCDRYIWRHAVSVERMNIIKGDGISSSTPRQHVPRVLISVAMACN